MDIHLKNIQSKLKTDTFSLSIGYPTITGNHQCLPINIPFCWAIV